MEEKEFDPKEAQAFILDAFQKQGDFLILGMDTLSAMVQAVLEEDQAYMHAAGVENGAIYDDDDAFDFMFAKMQERFPEQKMYAMRFVEDYLEYNEQYLERIGAIDWE